MAPHLGLQGKKKWVNGDSSWFETKVNGGALILTVLTNAANHAQAPYYVRGAAGHTLHIIQLAEVRAFFFEYRKRLISPFLQCIKNNKSDFRRLCEDAATLTAVVYESYERSEDPNGWPGPGMSDAVDNFLMYEFLHCDRTDENDPISFLCSTLQAIEEFARVLAKKGRFARAVNSVVDGNRIKEFRETLVQAMNRFEVRAVLSDHVAKILIQIPLPGFCASPILRSPEIDEEHDGKLSEYPGRDSRHCHYHCPGSRSSSCRGAFWR